MTTKVRTRRRCAKPSTVPSPRTSVPRVTSRRRWCPRTCAPSSRSRARRSGVLAGCDCVTETYRHVGPEIDLRWRAADGDELSAGDTVLELAGPLRPILTAERTALNFLGRLSGIATLTAQFVMAAHESNPSVAVLDTRKTTPGCACSKRRPCVPAVAPATASASLTRAGEGQPPGRDEHHRCGAPGARTVAGSDGRDRVRRPRPGGGGGAGGRRCRAARQHGSGHGGRGHRGGASGRAGPILTEVSGGVTLATIGAYAAAGPDGFRSAH